MREFAKDLREQMRLLDMDPRFAERNLNEGFSGGEKKRHEILQMALLRPELAILDETDSGLDVDALRVVAEGVNRLRGPQLGVLLITHYTRILRYISPDVVHVMVDGRVVESGGPELADQLEAEGYERRRGDPATETRRQEVPMTTVSAPLDVAAVRGDFPILERRVNGHPLIYLDSAATSQKPVQVLDAMDDYYRRHNANVHRGVHTLAEEATALFEAPAARWPAVGAERPRCSPRTSARPSTWSPTPGGCATSASDEILVTEMEHHSNLVPWQLVAGMTGAKVRPCPSPATTCSTWTPWTGCSGSGPASWPCRPCPTCSAPSTRWPRSPGGRTPPGRWSWPTPPRPPHAGVRLDDLVDFLGFTGHKALGPMGVGVLTAREELLDSMEPFLGGGEMIRDVDIDRSTWNTIPWRFEAGTPNVAEAVGLGAAVDYLQAIGMDRVRAHEVDVTGYALKRLGEIDGLRGRLLELEHRGGMVSFTLGEIHPHDVAQVLDSDGIAPGRPPLRQAPAAARGPGHHRLVLPVLTTDEVDALVAGLERVKRFFA